MHKGLEYESFGYGALKLEKFRYENDFVLDLSGEMNPNLGQNKAFKWEKDQVKVETKIGEGKASSSSPCSSFHGCSSLLRRLNEG